MALVFRRKLEKSSTIYLKSTFFRKLDNTNATYVFTCFYSLCFIYGQILHQCLLRTQNLAAHVMLLKKKVVK